MNKTNVAQEKHEVRGDCVVKNEQTVFQNNKVFLKKKQETKPKKKMSDL